jgi:hypothetical protein
MVRSALLLNSLHKMTRPYALSSEKESASSLMYARAVYGSLIARRIFAFHSIRRQVTSSAKVMGSQPDQGVITLPRSLLDTDFYKARTLTLTMYRDDNAAIIFANSSRCSRPCCITSLRPKQRTSSPTAMPTYTSPASVTSNSLRPYLVRTHFRLCSYFSLYTY